MFAFLILSLSFSEEDPISFIPTPILLESSSGKDNGSTINARIFIFNLNKICVDEDAQD